jgi:hypothetical protein
MIALSDLLLTQTTLFLVILDLIKLAQIDHISQMITLSDITLTSFHCTLSFLNELDFFFSYVIKYEMG